MILLKIILVSSTRNDFKISALYNLALGILGRTGTGKEGSMLRAGSTQQLMSRIAGTVAWGKQALRLQGWCQAASHSRWRVIQGHSSVFRLLFLVQAALPAGSTSPCSQTHFSGICRAQSSFLLLQTLTQACLTGYTIINHGWSRGLAFLHNINTNGRACSAFLPPFSVPSSKLVSKNRNTVPHIHNIN